MHWFIEKKVCPLRNKYIPEQQIAITETHIPVHEQSRGEPGSKLRESTIHITSELNSIVTPNFGNSLTKSTPPRGSFNIRNISI